ncbi:MAG TPA: AAA family ATPase [Methylomirabilota bacterium]|nr:AAA family ATPase [Methylomirabilota bacterium]
MKLKLTKVRFKNFVGFGNEWTEIDFTQSQTTLVVGKNGSGKSSALLDSISFALFNKPFRDINKPKLTNTISNKHCLVELFFIANGYSFIVRRGLKPNVFEIFKEGELINQTADNRDYQDAFEKYILKVDHKTFCQIIILGSAIFTPFMALPTPQRRSVVENLLDLQIFTTMNMLLSAQIKENDKKMDEIINKKNILNERIKIIQEHISQNQINRKEAVRNKSLQIKTAREDIMTLSHDRVKINNEIHDLREHIQHETLVTTRQQKLVKLQHQLAQKLLQLKNEINFFHNNETCPTCTQKIDSDFCSDILKNKNATKEEIKDALTELEKQSEEVQQQIKDIQDIHTQINTFFNDIHGINAQIEARQSNIEVWMNELEKLREETNGIDVSKLEEAEEELAILQTELNELKANEHVMHYGSTLLKDSGIKSKIIKTFIPVINQFINKYLAALDFFVEFTLNEQFEEKMLSRFRDDFEYNSFSQGEKMRLNIAILFAWRAIAKLRGCIDCNLIILDEILDGPLDDEGTEEILKLLTNLTKDENVFVISPKPKNLPQEFFGRILSFKKSRNFARLVT